MLKIEKINKVINVKVEAGNFFVTPLFIKAFSISLILHIVFFYVFTVARDTSDEGIILLPTEVEADKSVLYNLSTKNDTGVLTYSSGILLKPLEKLPFASPTISSYEIPFVKYIEVPKVATPSFDVIEESLADDRPLEFKSLILTVSVFPSDAVTIKSKCKESLLKKVDELQENFASFKLLIDSKTGKIISFEKGEHQLENATNYELLLKDIAFDPIDSLDTFTDLIIEFNTIKSPEPQHLVVFR